MKKFILFIFTALFLSNILTAQTRSGTAIGINLPTPVGVAYKYSLQPNLAIEGAVGISPFDKRTFHSYADFRYHDTTVMFGDYLMNYFYGFGAAVTAEDDGMGVGARGVAGLVWYLKNTPMDIFVESGPVFMIFPDAQLELHFSFGTRYYFN